MYAKLENGNLFYAPNNFNTGSNLIINFNKNIDLMKSHGFKEVRDIRPYYDNSTQYLTIEGYQENEESISVNYKVNEIVIDDEPTTPTLEERVTDLEEIVKEQVELIKTLSSRDNVE